MRELLIVGGLTPPCASEFEPRRLHRRLATPTQANGFFFYRETLGDAIRDIPRDVRQVELVRDDDSEEDDDSGNEY